MKHILVFLIFIIIALSCKDNPVINNDSENLKNDYYPISMGNWWEYTYNYKPNKNSDAWLKGEIRWEVVESNDLQVEEIFIIKETVNGMEIYGNPFNSNLDTNWIVNAENFLEWKFNSNGYVEIGPNNYFKNHLNIKVKRFHPDTLEYLTFDSFYTRPFRADSNIVHDDYTAHKITLQKNVGIVKWFIDSRSNSSPAGHLIIKNYHID